MNNTAIKVENISKRYRIGLEEELHDTFIGALTSWATSPIRNFQQLRKLSHFNDTPSPANKEPKTDNRSQSDIIWALRNISFEVKQGEVLGIIGRNGAGKSTLLKILCRITEASSGRAMAYGRIASLLEVGTGFHPELTGRENVFLNGSILGMTKSETTRKFDEIVDFSGVEKFIDTPVKRYSSGMQVRLAFSVAAHLEPEILLVDEVLAVGDVEFQKKCLGKMSDVTNEGRTILFVSHNMSAIRNLCPRTLLIENGELVSDTDTERAITRYLDTNLTKGAVVSCEEFESKVEGVINRKNPSIRLKEIALVDQQGLPRNAFLSDEEFRISVTYECLTMVSDLRVVVLIVDEENRPILTTQNTDASSDGKRFYRREPGVYKSLCIIPPNTFGEKRFYVTVHLILIKTEHLILNKIMGFDVSFQGYNNVKYASFENSFIRPKLNWETQSLNKKQAGFRG